MKNILALSSVMLLTSNLIFSAFLGGQISYRNISGYTYEINITVCKTYAQWDSIVVEFGDGTSNNIGLIDAIPSTNFTTYKYQGIHTYPGQGNYNILTELNNWENGIININNSGNVPFTLKTILNINSIIGSNTTPICTNEIFVDTAIVGQLYTFNPSLFDTDGDSLAFKLISCLNVPVYTFPYATSYFKMDSISGEINWNNPLGVGLYAIAYIVEEWRNNSFLISQITKQMTIFVKDEVSVETVILNNRINIFPNPTTGKIKINAENIKNILVINEIGEIVLNLNKTNEIDLANFPKGIYFIKVHTDSVVQIDKLVFQ